VSHDSSLQYSHVLYCIGLSNGAASPVGHPGIGPDWSTRQISVGFAYPSRVGGYARRARDQFGGHRGNGADAKSEMRRVSNDDFAYI
jgi:hypothetical protein